MEGRDLTGQVREWFGRQLSLFLQAIEEMLLAELTHLDGVFEGFSLPTEDGVVGRAGDGYHLQIQFVGQSPIEPELLLAEMLSAIEGGEVQEAEIHGLLDLVGVVTGQDHL